MNEWTSLETKFFVDDMLFSQYNDLLRRSVGSVKAEHRLLCAVLEEAIRSYVTNMKCSTDGQRNAFREVVDWFLTAENAHCELFSFHTVCDLLGVESTHIVKGLMSLRAQDLPPRRQHRVTACARNRVGLHDRSDQNRFRSCYKLCTSAERSAKYTS